ncbi:MAG: dihydroorotase [Alphaproteobacteria bacterium]|nr:dihydroorotase [Alphaproteobacteria bacterium]MCB9928010.1 dihydroorotase [Alphaproteobacteria bacterium]
MRRAFVNARLLDPATGLDRKGGLLVLGEHIADLGPHIRPDQLAPDIEWVDCGGHCLAPGLVDMRTQFREPGQEHKETIDSVSRAAASGGITAMVGLPNTDPVIDDVAVVEFVARRAREVKLVKVFVYGAVTKGLAGKTLTEMGLLREAGALAFTDGCKAVRDAQVMRNALSYARGFDALIIQHPEDPDLADGGHMNEGELATRLGLAGIPTAAESILLERDRRLVALTRGRYHAAHVSSAEGLEIVRRAKAEGLRFTADTAPPYFALNELEVEDYRTFAKVSPPLRAEPDRLAVVQALKDGTIDVIASDHAPHDQESKRIPFAQAEPGMVGVETLLPLALELYHDGMLSLLDLLHKMTVAPARLLGLDLGTLAVGKPADLVLFDLEKPWRLNVKGGVGKSKNAPYDGRPVQGQVRMTVVDGRIVYQAAET